LDSAVATEERVVVKTPPGSLRLLLELATFSALWFILCRHLSGEWSLNEQYSYGWLVPFFSAYLFWLRWQDASTERRTPPRPTFETTRRPSFQLAIAISIALIALLLLFPLRLFEIANPDWRPLSWFHALAVVALTLVFLWRIGGDSWLQHFAFPVAFFLVAVPWPTAVETPVIQGLMRIVAVIAAEAVKLIGIPAQLEGNLIRVSSGLVGVNEACSGVRSLQTSLMIGLLFGELKRLSMLRRVALVAVAAAIALVANLVRAVFLVWIAARQNLAAVSSWHDLVGYSIIALVFLGTMAAAWLLSEKGQRQKAEGNMAENRQAGTLASEQPLVTRQLSLVTVIVLGWLLLIEVASAAWYRAHERELVSSAHWDVEWPRSAPRFHETKINEDARRILRFDRGYAASWFTAGPESHAHVGPVICSAFFLRWEPGRNSALLANLHRPDVCLPSAGWKQVADTGVRDYAVTPSFALPFRHFEFERRPQLHNSPQTAHAFYCLWEDRAAAPMAGAARLPQMSGSQSTWTRHERLQAVLEGRRHLGQQVLELVLIAPHRIERPAAEHEFAELLPRVVKVADQNRRYLPPKNRLSD
jgi:exosortase